ncbi:putative bifunctional diguanylate cyclase/phosphodiesterase [Alkalicoccus chagannorensis]|uniref:putative bifunctional diguanylate cyclase/phosphodiesterase n=1 Tax=Alkalicoccus chagannorensis TaxID=427072 RepID=UPI000403CF71|nr:bifunctional diguanylate cyclase/phosphodiesterase [Alkalicoccus chagannorensis]
MSGKEERGAGSWISFQEWAGEEPALAGDELLGAFSTISCAVILDPEGKIQACTETFAADMGAAGKSGSYRQLVDPSSAGGEWERLSANLAEKKSGTYTLVLNSSSKKTYRVSMSYIDLPDQGVYLLLHEDISCLAHSEEVLLTLHHRDELTGLKNRKKLETKLSDKMHRSDAATLLLLDIERFTYFNDTLGHFTGDELIRQIAAALAALEQETVELYRYGGDKFAFLIEGIFDQQSIQPFLDRVLYLFHTPFFVHNKEVNLSVRIGASRIPEDAGTVEQLLKHTSMAAQHAKNQPMGTSVYFHPALPEQYDRKMWLETRLRRAVEDVAFHLVYQPQISLRTGGITGVEALIRWEDEELGLVPPSVFLPAAEEAGWMPAVDSWVLKEACRQGAEWYRKGKPLRIGVNISPSQFQDRRFSRLVQETLEHTGLPASYLNIEITENDLLHHQSDNVRTLKELKSAGVRVSIDDFGTGYSSLSYLRQFPVDTLKIDKSFIKEMVDNKNDQAIVTSIIQLAHNMNMKVTAEGVEQADVFPYLKKLQCDEMQGFYYSRPLPPEAVYHYTPVHEGKA